MRCWWHGWEVGVFDGYVGRVKKDAQRRMNGWVYLLILTFQKNISPSFDSQVPDPHLVHFLC